MPRTILNLFEGDTMNDQLIKGHFKGLDIAFTYATTTQLANEIIIRHDCDPVAAHLLGRALTGGLLAATIQPEGNRTNFCWKYHGALKTIIVDAGTDGTVRGLISPAHLNETPDAHDALYGESGELNVVITKDGKIESSSTTPVALHDVVNDLAYHYCISDQVETSMSVLIGFAPDPKKPIKMARGWMLQALPNTDLKRLDRLRERLQSEAIQTQLKQPNIDFNTIANALIAGEKEATGIYFDECPTPKFNCTCSQEKMFSVIRSLPIPERMELVKVKAPVRIRCQFCNQLYTLNIEDCIVAWNQNPNKTNK